MTDLTVAQSSLSAAPSALPVPARDNVLDGLRGIAVALVVLYHLHEYVPQLWPGETAFGESGALGKLMGFFWIGVDLFYMLSGYLIGSAVLKPSVWDPARFVKNRLTRIVPAYYVSMFLVLILIEQHFLKSPQGWVHIGLHALFLQGLQPWSMFSINGPYWTLSVEFGFYAVMLTLAPFLRTRWVWGLLLGMLAVGLLWRSSVWLQVEQAQRYFWALQLPGAIDEFAAGLTLAALQHRHGWLARGHRGNALTGAVLLLVGTVLVGACLNFFIRLSVDYWAHGSVVLISRLLLCTGFALWMTGFLLMKDQPWLNALVRYSGLGLLGRISFSVYLYHVPVILAMHRWADTLIQPGWLWVTLTVGLILACAAASFVLVERTFHPGL